VRDSQLDEAYASARALLELYLQARDDGERRAMVAALRPTRDELAHIFVAEAVNDVAASYAMLWNNRPLWPDDGARELTVVCARAGDFLSRSPAARQMPGGYIDIARYLLPRPIWCAWRLGQPGRAQPSSFDGLVRVDGIWRWCPRPWRVLPEPRPVHPWLWTD
jgi:hypothetical protein